MVIGWREARSDPVVRGASIGLAEWPAGVAPVRTLLLADPHLCGAAMGETRLARINRSVARLRPDLILIAGDFASKTNEAGARCAAGQIGKLLSGWRPRLGIVAVLGNHDNWSAPTVVARALRVAGATVVENDAVRRGPLLIGVSGDTVSGHARLGGTLNALRRLRANGGGATIFLSHSPDIVKWLPWGRSVLLAGHTHCGQIMVPVIGAMFEVSELHGNQLRCGRVEYRGIIVVVTAGLGTSHVPLRLGAPPDLWVVTFGPQHPNRRRP